MTTHAFRMTNNLLLAACCVIALLWASGAAAQVKVTTAAGGFINDSNPGTASALQSPTDVAMDSKGNAYVTDNIDQRIRELTTTGILKTIAGTGLAGYGGDGGLASKATISFPRGIVVDSKGNIIFCDMANNRIRKIAPNKIITTIAGTGVAGFSGDGGPATAAMIHFPLGLSLDKAGNLYFADRGNQRIREVDSSGIVHTLAGNGTAGFTGDGGLATSASLNEPRLALSDNAGNLYITDQMNHRVRKVTGGIISTFAGNGKAGCAGDHGPATAAALGFPSRMLIFQGSLFISNAGCARIRAINLGSNTINTMVGTTFGFDGNGHSVLASLLDGPAGILIDNTGTHALIVDNGNNQLRTANIATSVLTGSAGGYTGDGLTGTKASLNGPENIAFDALGNMYVAETNNHRVRKVTPAGIISTFAGTGISGYSGDGGPATSATLYFPFGVGVDKTGNVYITDNFNAVIRKVDVTGKITTFSQNANYFNLLGLAVDSLGNLYAADDLACVVWQITPAASVSVAAGVQGTCGYNADGIAATAAFLNAPYGVTVDTTGHLYIGDYANNRVRKVTSGVISTVAGKGTCGFSGDNGMATLAMLCNPAGVAVDSKNNLYIGDYSNSRVRKVTAGTITTLAGTGNTGYNGNALVATSTNVDGPSGLAVTSKGVLYVADDAQYRVRKIH